MFPRSSTLACLTLAGLAACSADRPVSPTAEFVDGVAGAITTASTITAEYDLNVGQTVRIVPRSTTRTNRLRWVTSNSGVASVNSNGVVSALAAGTSTVTVSGSGVLESYAVVVAAPAPTLTGFSLQPATSVTLNVGQTQQFTASQTWSDGLTRTSGVTFTATGGTISSSGLFTAGNLAGTFMVIASCSCGATAIADTTPVVVNSVAQLTKLTLSPKTVSLSAGATQQFTVSANWSTGATDVPPVTWSATGGTVNSTGAYVAPTTAGTYRVIVAHSGGSVRDTAVVTVAGAAQLTRLTISPKTVTLNAGASQQFSVAATWSTGATELPPVTWSATGGTVSSNGAFLAPSSVGTYRVIVAHSGGAVRDTALVTVVSNAVPPTGESLFFSDDFESGAPASRNGFLWNGSKNAAVKNTRAYSGRYALEFVYGPTLTGADYNSEQRFDMGRYLSEVWIEYMLYVPANFVHRNDAPNNNKFLMLWRDTYSDLTGGTWRVGAEYTRKDDQSSYLRFMSSRWDLNSWTSGGAWPTPAPASAVTLFSANGPIRPGQWTRVRFHVKASSSRTAEDGEIHIWANDQLIFGYTRGRFHNFYATPVDAVLRNGYILGWSNSGFAETTIFNVDDVKFYQSNPNW